MGILGDILAVFCILGIITAMVLAIAFVIWCAVFVISLIIGRDLLTSLFVIIGLVFIISLLSHAWRGKPIVALTFGNKNKCQR